jgi:tetratricopeptide (TPR) repeat protein
LTDIFALQSEIARSVAHTLGLRLGAQASRTRPATKDLDSYFLYLKGRVLWNRRTLESIQEALKNFEEAVAKDPNLAPAHSGLADCYLVLVTNFGHLPWADAGPKVKQAALRALELDGQLGEAHASLGLALNHEYDYEAAEREFRRAIELSPAYYPAHLWYYHLLRDQGRFEEAGREIALAQESDPLSPVVLMQAGEFASYQRRDEDADRYWDHALEIEPGILGSVLDARIPHDLSRSRLAEARTALASYEAQLMAQGEDLSTTHDDRLARFYGLLGREADARRILERLLKFSEKEYVGAAEIALVYGALGDTDRFFEWASRGVDDCSLRPLTLRLAPYLAGYRSDPRYQQILRRWRLSK